MLLINFHFISGIARSLFGLGEFFVDFLSHFLVVDQVVHPEVLLVRAARVGTSGNLFIEW